MKQIATHELSGATLDWAVAKCEGEDYSPVTTHSGIGQEFPPTKYSTDWAQGGPLIEREKLTVGYADIEGGFWTARTAEYPPKYIKGQTPLMAAMRCYVASKLGDTVDVPTELT